MKVLINNEANIIFLFFFHVFSLGESQEIIEKKNNNNTSVSVSCQEDSIFDEILEQINQYEKESQQLENGDRTLTFLDEVNFKQTFFESETFDLTNFLGNKHIEIESLKSYESVSCDRQTTSFEYPNQSEEYSSQRTDILPFYGIPNTVDPFNQQTQNPANNILPYYSSKKYLKNQDSTENFKMISSKGWDSRESSSINAISSSMKEAMDIEEFPIPLEFNLESGHEKINCFENQRVMEEAVFKSSHDENSMDVCSKVDFVEYPGAFNLPSSTQFIDGPEKIHDELPGSSKYAVNFEKISRDMTSTGLEDIDCSYPCYMKTEDSTTKNPEGSICSFHLKSSEMEPSGKKEIFSKEESFRLTKKIIELLQEKNPVFRFFRLFLLEFTHLNKKKHNYLKDYEYMKYYPENMSQEEEPLQILIFSLFTGSPRNTRNCGISAVIMPMIYKGFYQYNHQYQLESEFITKCENFFIIQFEIIVSQLVSKLFVVRRQQKCEFALPREERYIGFLKDNFVIRHAGQELLVTYKSMKKDQILFSIFRVPDGRDLDDCLQTSKIISESHKDIEIRKKTKKRPE